MGWAKEVASAYADLRQGRQLQRTRRIRAPLERVAREEGLPLPLLLGISWVESSHDPEAVNPESGAAGLFQVMPFHHGSLVERGVWSSREDWRDPYLNAKAGALILHESGYGRKHLRGVLASYGGFVTVDPKEYQDKVLARTMMYGLADLAGMI